MNGRRSRVNVLGVLLAALALSAAGQEPPKAAKPADVRSLEAMDAAIYDVISGPAGQKRDWDRFRSMFASGARLIPATPKEGGGATARILSPDDFIARSGGYFEKNGFFEAEVSRKVEAFGNIAHIFSTYESRNTKDGPVIARGINSIQLLKDGDRWWVVTIYWDAERPDNPIPATYLPKP